MRRLATIREIRDIKPISGADLIEVAVIDGWECVVSKKDNFKIGDLVVYIEIDSIVPATPVFEFMRNRKYRVKTIKLRQQVSQGLAMPMTILPDNKKYSLDDDVTEVLGITKHDPQAEQEAKIPSGTLNASRNIIVKYLMRFKWFRRIYMKPKKGAFPSWIVKTDEERIQNKINMFEIEKGLNTLFSVTEKLDGCSLTLFVERLGKKRFDFGVCSRNLRLTTPDNSSWWAVANQLGAEDVLKDILGTGKRIVLQGEIVGTGIQGNKYNISGYDFYAFNLIVDGIKLPTHTTRDILAKYNIKTVPLLEEGFMLKDTIPEMVEYAKGNSVLTKTKREGVVVRNYEKNISFKVINPDFLLAEKE